MDVIKNEPVLIQSLVQAILGLVLAFGVDLSNEQTGSIMAVVAVILAIVARMFVTPTNKLNTPIVPPSTTTEGM
ncbi:MAG TPA: hypothetical protein VNS88_10810 [Nitrospiraceae bacterium]|nr:hypothetical protein [Nitrospiraceae bacterium]